MHINLEQNTIYHIIFVFENPIKDMLYGQLVNNKSLPIMVMIMITLGLSPNHKAWTSFVPSHLVVAKIYFSSC